MSRRQRDNHKAWRLARAAERRAAQEPKPDLAAAGRILADSSRGAAEALSEMGRSVGRVFASTIAILQSTTRDDFTLKS